MIRKYVASKSWESESPVCALVYLQSPDESPAEYLDENLHILDNGPGFPGGRWTLTIENSGWQSDNVESLESRLIGWHNDANAARETVPGELSDSDWTLDSFVADYCKARGFDMDSDIARGIDLGGVFGVYFSDVTRESWPVSEAVDVIDRALSDWWPKPE